MKGRYVCGLIALVVAGVIFLCTKSQEIAGTSSRQSAALVLDQHQHAHAKSITSDQKATLPFDRPRSASRSPKPAVLPSGNLASNLPSLEARALAGHPEIAYALSQQILSCYTKSQPDADAFFGDVSTTFAEKCRGLTDSDYQNAMKLIAYAARAGDVNAQNSYLADADIWMDRNPSLVYQSDYAEAVSADTLNFLHGAAANGNVEAMVNLAHIYEMGIITPQDHVQAYAYMYSVDKTGLLPGSQRVLAMWQSQFSPNEIMMGTRKGEEIFESCCRGL